jgi:hypothetical protein
LRIKSKVTVRENDTTKLFQDSKPPNTSKYVAGQWCRPAILWFPGSSYDGFNPSQGFNWDHEPMLLKPLSHQKGIVWEWLEEGKHESSIL